MAAITAAAIGVAGTVYASNKASKDAKKNRQLAREGIEAADPFRQYRPQYAGKLDELMKDPSSIMDTPEYKARMQSASRQLAAQGYSGSGNALVEAAEAGAGVYQQAFNNLAMLSGAATTPGGGYGTALEAQSAGSAQELSSLAGITNNLSNLALTVGSRFNRPATTPTTGAGGFGIGLGAGATRIGGGG